MEFNQATTIGIFLLVVVVGVGGLLASGVMAASTVLMMVAPSVLVFGGLCLFLGVKHGEHRARGA
ncbi:DUF7333 family protein [Halorubellus salinus]|uniref:DUF7333 family protein n=1 Tax=Halorubellus salinus TaxID=755309 RepID=UPI001D095DF9|nr:hypothetical protein [Halorubellus salinus]